MITHLYKLSYDRIEVGEVSSGLYIEIKLLLKVVTIVYFMYELTYEMTDGSPLIIHRHCTENKRLTERL